jgi:hypothetical protein
MTVQTVDTPATRGSRTAALTLTAGALFVVVPPLVEFVSGDAFALMGLALLLLVAALPGLHRLQAGRDGRLGRWGLRLTLTGLVTLIVLVLAGDVLDAALSGSAQSVAEGVWTVLAGLGALSALGGVIAFSSGMTRARVLAPAGIWVFLGGMTLGLASESFEQSLSGSIPWLADVLPPLGFVVAGLGLVLLGRSAQRASIR